MLKSALILLFFLSFLIPSFADSDAKLVPRQGGVGPATTEAIGISSSTMSQTSDSMSSSMTTTMMTSSSGTSVPASVSASISKSIASVSSASASIASNLVTQGSGSGDTGGVGSTQAGAARERISVSWASLLSIGAVMGVAAAL
ncbi:hypothetical protein MMC13_000633 [Lambiella insularis]|nr:hypothetical protein [Lambiella insularis]